MVFIINFTNESFSKNISLCKNKCLTTSEVYFTAVYSQKQTHIIIQLANAKQRYFVYITLM